MSPIIIDTTIGINKYYLPIPSYIRKGSLLLLEYISSSRIGIENEILNNGNIIYSDFLLTGTDQLTLTRITPNMNSRVLVNSIVDYSYYKAILNIINKYSFFIPYQLTARMNRSTLLLNASINFKNSMT